MVKKNDKSKKKTRINQTCCVLMTTGEHRWQAVAKIVVVVVVPLLWVLVDVCSGVEAYLMI